MLKLLEYMVFEKYKADLATKKEIEGLTVSLSQRTHGARIKTLKPAQGSRFPGLY